MVANFWWGYVGTRVSHAHHPLTHTSVCKVLYFIFPSPYWNYFTYIIWLFYSIFCITIFYHEQNICDNKKNPLRIIKGFWIRLSYHQNQDHGSLVDVVCVDSSPLPKPAPEMTLLQFNCNNVPPLIILHTIIFLRSLPCNGQAWPIKGVWTGTGRPLWG